uniref:(northern house mosquito) hypothetical protein n=1 Tax=Culex pipiens TaxID=7175 RepID=A0A8D8J9G0_CULPI
MLDPQSNQRPWPANSHLIPVRVYVRVRSLKSSSNSRNRSRLVETFAFFVCLKKISTSQSTRESSCLKSKRSPPSFYQHLRNHQKRRRFRHIQSRQRTCIQTR